MMLAPPPPPPGGPVPGPPGGPMPGPPANGFSSGMQLRKQMAQLQRAIEQQQMQIQQWQCQLQMRQQQQMLQMQQMQAAAQMSQMSQMSMMGGMQMMPMLQMGAGGMMPSPQVEDEGDREISMFSEDELGIQIRAQDAVVKEAEREAKKSVDKGTYPGLKYVGTIVSVDPEEGFGFVHSPNLQRDSFLGQKNIAENELEVGDVIAFKIEDNIGKPKVSFNPKVLKDVTKQKKKLQKLRDRAKMLNMASKRPGPPMPQAAPMPPVQPMLNNQFMPMGAPAPPVLTGPPAIFKAGVPIPAPPPPPPQVPNLPLLPNVPLS